MTTDHVIPRLLFMANADAIITAPSCDLCQKTKRLGEEELRNLICVDIDGAKHPVCRRNLRRALRAELRRPGRLTRSYRQAQRTTLFSPGGIFLREAFELEWDIPRVLRTVNFCVRGLYFHFRGEFLDVHTPVETMFVEHLDRPEWRQMFRPFGIKDFIILGNGVAEIVSWRAEEPDEHSTLWTLVFNNGVLFVAGTGQYAGWQLDGADIAEPTGLIAV